MLSTCPNCKKQIEHEDYLFEVVCECNTRFNPFMAPAAEVAGLENVEPAAAAPEWKEPQPVDYSESQSVFNELKDFAEGVETPEKPAIVAAKTPAPRPAPRAHTPSDTAGLSDAIMTSGDGLPGYKIDAYLPPLSASAPLDVEQSNPLKAGFDALWDQAVGCGASGVVAVRWVLSPDGSRVVLSGTPVQCTKEGA